MKSAVDGKKAGQIRKRLEIFAKEIDAKFDFYAATQSGEKDVKGYRKPNVGMWREMLSRREGASTTLTSTFYVGDAANRPQDHSDADVAFALRNCGGIFVPEQFFEGGSFRRFLEKSSDDEKKIGKEETLDNDARDSTTRRKGRRRSRDRFLLNRLLGSAIRFVPKKTLCISTNNVSNCPHNFTPVSLHPARVTPPVRRLPQKTNDL